MSRMHGKIGKINSEAKEEPKQREGSVKAAPGKVHTRGLAGAVEELKRQHPEHHADKGPHHDKNHHEHGSHVRYEPLAGLKPGKW